MTRLLLILFIASAIKLNAQKFNLSDSVFRIGDIYQLETRIVFPPNQWQIPEENFLQLDNFATFLIMHPELKIEVGVHLDTRVSESSSQRIDSNRAQSIVDYLCSSGVEKYRFTAVGYWKNQPLISDKEISKLKTIQEKEEAHLKNKRIEFKIIEIFPLDEIEMNYDKHGNLESKGKYIEVDSTECFYCFYNSGKQYFYTDPTRVRLGTWEFYYPNGKIKAVGNYSQKVHEYTGLSYPLEWKGQSWPKPVPGYQHTDYLKDGIWEYFDEQGNNIRTEKYVCGFLIHKADMYPKN